MRSWRSGSVEETRALGETLVRELESDGVLLLSGDLGAGKTVLAQGVAAGLGIDPRQVQSPSFTLIRDYAGPRGRMIHVDLYRLEPDQVPALGLEEILAGPGVKVVEWADRLPFRVPGALSLELKLTVDPQGRLIEERSPGGARPGSNGGRPQVPAGQGSQEEEER